MKTFLATLLLIAVFVTGCGSETHIMPNATESKLSIDKARSLVSFYVLLENENRQKVGPLYAKFMIYDDTLQDAIGAELIDFTATNGEKQPFYIDGKQGYFISESFYYEAELDSQHLVNMVEVVISDENNMELLQFLIPTVEVIEAPTRS